MFKDVKQVSDQIKIDDGKPMAFQVIKINKLDDQIEALAYDWALKDVCEYFKVEEVSQLTEEQAVEMMNYAESEGEEPYYDAVHHIVAMVLRTMYYQWEEEYKR